MASETGTPAGNPPAPLQNPPPRSPTDPRALRQLGLFAAGSVFMLASLAVTRRSIARKKLAAIPSFYQQNHRAPVKAGDSLRGGKSDISVQGGFIAAEALGLATLNTLSFAIMAAGGVSYAFDISNLEDLRRYARVRMYGAEGRRDETAEKEMEEWAVKIMEAAGVDVREAAKAEEREAKEKAAKEAGKEEEKAK